MKKIIISMIFCFLVLSQNLFASFDINTYELDTNPNYDFSKLGVSEEDFNYKFIYHNIYNNVVYTYYFYTDKPIFVNADTTSQYHLDGRYLILNKQFQYNFSSTPLATFVYSNGLNNTSVKASGFNFMPDSNNFDYYSNYDIRYDNGDLALENKEGDDAIGDSNSRLKLTYEYNEINTACKVNATLEGGEFTDRIYYSNYMPGVNGALASKKAFPHERSNFNRKSVFVFPS